MNSRSKQPSIEVTRYQTFETLPENSGLHRYCEKDILSLLYRFPFEYVSFEDTQVSGYNSKRHFMNSVFVNPGIYSCAVDAFLEISTHLCNTAYFEQIVHHQRGQL